MSYNLLKGKRGIVFGALNEQSIAWKVAEKAVEEGAVITLSNTPVAVRMGEVSALAEKLNCEVIPADATSVEDLENVFKRSMEVLGGKIDFVLHSIGMSPNVRKKRTYDDLDYDMLNKTLDISAVSFHKMIQSAKKLDAINEYGSIVALSYVAAQRTFYGYNDMADAKALLESSSVDNDSITELDFSNINGFGVSAEYGDPYAKGKNWDITDETAITEFRQLLNESLSYAVDENTAKNGMLSKGTAQWKVSDGKEYSIIVRQTTADAYNVKINKCYYNVSEDLINKLSDIITEQKEN